MAELFDGDLEVRRVTADDLDSMLGLIRVCLGPGSVPRTREFLRWKHHSSPFGPSLGLVAMASGELVGLRLFLRWRFERAGTVYEAVRPVDTVVHPEWRGRGLFTRLTTALVEVARDLGCGFAYNTPNANSRPGYLHMGWKSLGRAPLLGKLRRPLGIRTPGRGSGRTPPGASGGRRSRTVRDLLEVLQERGSPGERAAGGSRLATIRDLDSLKWRYRDVPGLEYLAEWESSGGSFAAVIFRTRDRRGRRELSVAELMVGDDPEGSKVAARLLKRVVLDTDPDWIVGCASAGTVERRGLLRAGLLPAGAVAPRIVVRELRVGTGIDLTAASGWRWSLGDLEVF